MAISWLGDGGAHAGDAPHSAGQLTLRCLLELALLATAIACVSFFLFVAVDERSFRTSQRDRLEELVVTRLRASLPAPDALAQAPPRAGLAPAGGSTAYLASRQ